MRDDARAYYQGGGKQTHIAGEFLTDQGLADLLGVTTRTTLRWRREGGGPPFIRVGVRYVRYRRPDIDAWTAANTFATLAAETVANGERVACGAIAVIWSLNTEEIYRILRKIRTVTRLCTLHSFWDT